MSGDEARPPRALGIDYGRARLGLAVTDGLGIAAHPIGTLPNRGREPLLEAIEREVREREIEHIVLGLPLNMDGSRGPMAREVERFARALRRRLELPVELWDERLSSHEVESRLAERGVSWRRRKKRVDAAAAALILGEWLAAWKRARARERSPRSGRPEGG